jgi:hypothetical protein
MWPELATWSLSRKDPPVVFSQTHFGRQVGEDLGEVQQRIRDLEDEAREDRQDRLRRRDAKIEKEAADFAEELFGPEEEDDEAQSAARQNIVAIHRQAALDDDARPRNITYQEGGKEQRGTRVDAVRASHRQHLKHQHRSDKPAVRMSADRKRQLLSYTELGRQAIETLERRGLL